MIAGSFQGDFPFLDVAVEIRRFGVGPTPGTFLVDTGAGICVLSARDAARIGIAQSQLSQSPIEANVGVGGLVSHFRAFARFTFQSVERPPTVLPFPLRIASTDDELPSVLGMDLLGLFRLMVSKTEDRVELEPQFQSRPA